MKDEPYKVLTNTYLFPIKNRIPPTAERSIPEGPSLARGLAHNLGSMTSTFPKKLQEGIFKFNIKRESLLLQILQNDAAVVRVCLFVFFHI